MYTEFYGLKELPFALTPDPRYIYFTPSHTEVMANLHYGIESGRGLIVVTGEVGTGTGPLEAGPGTGGLMVDAPRPRSASISACRFCK